MPKPKMISDNMYVFESTEEEMKITDLELENAQLWYDMMNKDAKLESSEAEIAQLWYELMMGSVG